MASALEPADGIDEMDAILAETQESESAHPFSIDADKDADSIVSPASRSQHIELSPRSTLLTRHPSRAAFGMNAQFNPDIKKTHTLNDKRQIVLEMIQATDWKEDGLPLHELKRGVHCRFCGDSFSGYSILKPGRPLQVDMVHNFCAQKTRVVLRSTETSLVTAEGVVNPGEPLIVMGPSDGRGWSESWTDVKVARVQGASMEAQAIKSFPTVAVKDLAVACCTCSQKQDLRNSLASRLQFDDSLFDANSIIDGQGDSRYWTMGRAFLHGRFHLGASDGGCTWSFRPPDLRESRMRRAAKVLQSETAPVRYAREWTTGGDISEIKMMKLLERAVKCYVCGRRCYDDYGQKIAVRASDGRSQVGYINQTVCTCANKGQKNHQIVCKPGVVGETPLHDAMLLGKWKLATQIMTKYPLLAHIPYGRDVNSCPRCKEGLYQIIAKGIWQLGSANIDEKQLVRDLRGHFEKIGALKCSRSDEVDDALEVSVEENGSYSCCVAFADRGSVHSALQKISELTRDSFGLGLNYKINISANGEPIRSYCIGQVAEAHDVVCNECGHMPTHNLIDLSGRRQWIRGILEEEPDAAQQHDMIALELADLAKLNADKSAMNMEKPAEDILRASQLEDELVGILLNGEGQSALFATKRLSSCAAHRTLHKVSHKISRSILNVRSSLPGLFEGETVVHMAIAEGRTEILSHILGESGSHPNVGEPAIARILCSRAYGSFFLPEKVPGPRGESIRNISKCSEDEDFLQYDGYYLGEYPYHFAAALGREESMQLVWKHAKQLGMGNPCFWQDGLGNTALHLAVQYRQHTAIQKMLAEHCFGDDAKSEMLKETLKSSEALRLFDTTNFAGLTALAYTVQHRDRHTFEFLLSQMTDIIWSFAGSKFQQLSLHQLDSFRVENDALHRKPEYKSVIEVVATEEVDELSEVPIIKELMYHKWVTYRFMFAILEVVPHLTMVILLGLHPLTGSSGDHDHLAFIGIDPYVRKSKHAAQTAGEKSLLHKFTVDEFFALVLIHWFLAALFSLWNTLRFCWRKDTWKRFQEMRFWLRTSGIASEITDSDLNGFLMSLYKMWPFLLNTTSAICVIFSRDPVWGSDTDDILMAVLSIVLWARFIVVCSALPYIGKLIIVIHFMLFRAVVKYLLVFSPLLVGFAWAFSTMYNDVLGPTQYRNQEYSVFSLFFAMLGEIGVTSPSKDLTSVVVRLSNAGMLHISCVVSHLTPVVVALQYDSNGPAFGDGQGAARFVLVLCLIFLVIFNLLGMNLLIAMLNDEYLKIYGEEGGGMSEIQRLFEFNRTRKMLDYERFLVWFCRCFDRMICCRCFPLKSILEYPLNSRFGQPEEEKLMPGSSHWDDGWAGDRPQAKYVKRWLVSRDRANQIEAEVKPESLAAAKLSRRQQLQALVAAQIRIQRDNAMVEENKNI